MGILNFVRSLVTEPDPIVINDDPFGKGEKPVAAALAPTVSAPSSIVQRDEIIDARMRIAGYRFLAVAPDGCALALSALVDALSKANVAAFAERRLALLPLPLRAGTMPEAFLGLVGPHTVFVVDLPGEGSEREDWLAFVRTLREAGAKLALRSDDIPGNHQYLRDLVSYVLIDFTAHPLSRLESVFSSLKAVQPNLHILVDRVGDWSERRYCLAHNVDYCLGEFTTKQDEEENKTGEIDQSRLVLIEMINLLRKDAELSELVAVAKRDPGVTVKLVSMANSPLLGLTQPVSGIEQAILFIGREQLYRWLSIAMFHAGSSSGRDESLLELALVRGRFLELIGQTHHDAKACGELFLVGVLSLLDCLLGVPMAQVVERLNLAADMREVLMNSDGPLGRYLLLAVSMEKGRTEKVAQLADQLDLPLEMVQRASAEAWGWAEAAMRPG